MATKTTMEEKNGGESPAPSGNRPSRKVRRHQREEWMKPSLDRRSHLCTSTEMSCQVRFGLCGPQHSGCNKASSVRGCEGQVRGSGSSTEESSQSEGEIEMQRQNEG